MHMDTAATKKKNYCYCDKSRLIPRNLRIHLSIAAFTLHIVATFFATNDTRLFLLCH